MNSEVEKRSNIWKDLEQEIYQGKSRDEYFMWMGTLDKDQIKEELRRLKEIRKKYKEVAKKSGKLLSYYMNTAIGYLLGFFSLFACVEIPNLLINLFQVFLVVEKIFEFRPFGHFSWFEIFIPTLVDVFFRIIFKSNSNKSK